MAGRLIHLLEGAAFGLTDGVICALGIMIGAAAATSNPKLVIISGIIAGVADAVGNSFGILVSQSTEREVQKHIKRKGETVRVHPVSEVWLNGFASFITTILIFLILLLPFFFFSVGDAMIVSVFAGLLILFVLGFFVGRLGGEKPFKAGFKYAAAGFFGALLSFLVGEHLKEIFG